MGPDKALDTNKYFVIAPNYLGGCYGSTGPASINPETRKQFGSEFPHVSAADQADVFAKLIGSFGIEKLHSVIGPSVGGLIALTFATRHPEKVQNIISLASGFKTTVLNRLCLFEQIMAIENDQHFNGGNYYESDPPTYGLALARMISHKTFVHLDTFERRARRDVKQDTEALSWYKVRDTFSELHAPPGKKIRQTLRCQHLPAHHRHVVALQRLPRSWREDSGRTLCQVKKTRPQISHFQHRFRFLFLSRGTS